MQNFLESEKITRIGKQNDITHFAPVQKLAINIQFVLYQH